MPVLQFLSQRNRFRLALLGIKNNTPFAAVTARQFAGVIDKIGPSDAPSMTFLLQAFALEKLAELAVRDKYRGVVEAQRIRHRGFQRLAGFGAIGNSRIQCQEGEPGRLVEFRPLVGVNQVARVGLREDRRAGRQDVLQAVDDLDISCHGSQVHQFSMTYEAVIRAGRPCVPERQLEVVIDLLEAQLVAERVLVDITAGLESSVLLTIERLPIDRFRAAADFQYAAGARAVGAIVKLVDRYVWEQSGFG